MKADAARSNDEGFEEWDAEFLDQLIQVEELALTSTALNPNVNTSSSHLHQLPPQSLNFGPVSDYISISYSPPRELSQRTSSFRSSVVRSSNGFAKTVASYSASVPSVERRDEVDKEFEIRRLKKELGRVSKQLSNLEQECVELRKERHRKSEQLRVVFSKKDENLDDTNGSKSEKLDHSLTLDHGADQHSPKKVIPNDNTGPEIDLTSYTCKAIGVQTDNVTHAPKLPPCETQFASQNLSNKLIAIWAFQNEAKLGQNLFSDLVKSCEADFHVLFGCMGNQPSRGTSLQISTSDVDSPEAAKVSELYSMLTKINNGMVPLEGLFGPLLDLCILDNVVIAQRSLHVLHVFLLHLLCNERNFRGRKNVMVEGLTCGSQAGEDLDANRVDLSHPTDISHGVRHPDLKNRHLNVGICSVSGIEWYSLFKLMHQILMKHTEQSARVEAVSIMNLILMRSNAFTERKKFDHSLLFESVIHLLKKEAGLQVQKLAVHFLFLILNCPSLLGTFCSGRKDGTTTCSAEDSAEYSLTPENFGFILLGLVECLTSSGSGIQATHLLCHLASYSGGQMSKKMSSLQNKAEDISNVAGDSLNKQKELLKGQSQALDGLRSLANFQSEALEESRNILQKLAKLGHEQQEELLRMQEQLKLVHDHLVKNSKSILSAQEIKLRRNTIILLAFLASSGRPGFEIVVNHKVQRDSSLLMLILQLVVSEVDREVAATSCSQEVVRERTLLIRESLILLNRLVSNPAYSATVLRALTTSRDMANLTIDIAKRLSWKSQVSGHLDGMKKIREVEIVDLAGVFKKRVFTYLGDIS